MAVGPDLATGLIASALFEMARRPISLLKSANFRHREISRAIESKNLAIDDKHAENVNKAFVDLTKVLANEYGKYTVPVDQFLK